MKMFTLIAIVLIIVSTPIFSSGQTDNSSDKTPAGVMEPAETMDAGAPESGTVNLLGEFKDLNDAMMLAQSKPTVLFFHAGWCPTCRAAVKDFEANSGDLEHVNLLLVDYDNSSDLQKKYGVTYQHTFVQISADGTAAAKWNGGATRELLRNITNKEMQK